VDRRRKDVEKQNGGKKPSEAVLEKRRVVRGKKSSLTLQLDQRKGDHHVIQSLVKKKLWRSGGGQDKGNRKYTPQKQEHDSVWAKAIQTPSKMRGDKKGGGETGKKKGSSRKLSL